METEYCKYSKYVKEGLDEYLICSKSSKYCGYQRFCTTKKRVVHTDDAANCSIIRAEEGIKMASKKNQPRKIQKDENSALKIEVENPKKKGIVLTATPNYYIVAIDNSNVKFVQKNNYKKGDIIEL